MFFSWQQEMAPAAVRIDDRPRDGPVRSHYRPSFRDETPINSRECKEWVTPEVSTRIFRAGISLYPAAAVRYIATMSRKTMIMIGMVVGSFVGGYLPTLLGADSVSLGSLLGSGAGGFLGIWIAVTFTR
jgi:hypothetical protein